MQLSVIFLYMSFDIDMLVYNICKECNDEQKYCTVMNIMELLSCRSRGRLYKHTCYATQLF